MKYAHYLLTEAIGKVLSETIEVNNRRFLKGKKLTIDDVDFLKSKGLRTIFAAEAADDDVDASTVLGMIAARLCGKNTAYTIGDSGLCKIISTTNGVLQREDERVAKFNHKHKHFILNTVPAWKQAKSGEVIAELELTAPALSQGDVDDMLLYLSGNTSLISVNDSYPRKTAFVYVGLSDSPEENAHFTAQVAELIQNFSALELKFEGEYCARYDIESVADEIQSAENAGYELIFIISPCRSVSEDDVIPSGMKRYVEELVCASVPAIGASDMYIGTKRKARIIALPYDYAEHDSLLHYQEISKAIVLEKLTQLDFKTTINAPLKEGGKLTREEKARLIEIQEGKDKENKANIGIVILAAGRSSRTKTNKLLAERDGEPLFMNAVHAALRSKGKPIFVITGHQHEEIEDYLKDEDINVVYNSDYISGVRTSIRLGLRLMPASCDGAILLPADMPNITEKQLDKMIDAFEKGKEKQVIMMSYRGAKKNPILWSKELYPAADLVPEGSELRTVFAEHEDYTKLIKIAKESTLLDVTYPADIEQLQK